MSYPGSYERKRSARRIFERVQRGAGTLQPGEQLESAVWGHKYLPGLQLLLLFGALGDTLYLILARPYFLALTNQRFMLLNGSRFGLVSKPRDAVFTVPAESVRLDLGKKFVVRKIATVYNGATGDEVKVAVHRQFWGELDYMESLLSGRAR